MQGMETAYVGNGVSASEASKTVGQSVIDAILEKNGTNVGRATIEVEQIEENNVKGNALISIYTTDYIIGGTITIQDGFLAWGDIEPNIPKPITSIGEISPILPVVKVGKTVELMVTTNNGATENVRWESQNEAIATILNTSNKGRKVTIKGKAVGTTTIIAKNESGNITQSCTITVQDVVRVTSLSLDKGANANIFEGDEILITALVNSGAEEELSWECTSVTGDVTIQNVQITTSGNIKEVGKIIVTGVGTATIRVASTQKNATITLRVKSPYVDSSYVQYDVEYKDVYTKTQYSKNTGWRILSTDSPLDVENEATYTGNLKIISTGIPAKINCVANSISGLENDETTIGKWAGNSTQRLTYTESYYGTASNKNIYLAAGLMYNFRNIIFNATENPTDNKGCFDKINNQGNEIIAGDTITGNTLFNASNKVTDIRSVCLADLTGSNGSETTYTEPRTGLFNLSLYTPESGRSTPYYLASPYSTSSSWLYIYKSGSFNQNQYYWQENSEKVRSYTNGIRPVITLTDVTMTKNGHVWIIQ